METKKVISKKNLPFRSPVASTVVYVLAMDYWNAPQWLWGAVGLIMTLLWIAWIVSYFKEEELDVFNESDGSPNDGTSPKKKSKFQERLEQEISKKSNN